MAKEEQKFILNTNDILEIITMSRTLLDGKNEFEIENILGSSDGTYGIEEKYSEKQIIKYLDKNKLI